MGGIESRTTRPATTSHLGMTLEDRLRMGITDTLFRFSTGIESLEDLLEDLTQALEKSTA